MGDKHHDANLIIKLYELRREEVMRKARNWYVLEFNPNSVQDITNALMGEHSAYYRMVTSYWEMAASFVINGAIDSKMFDDANAEHTVVFAKIEPFVKEVRELYNVPKFARNLEQLVMRAPDAQENLGRIRERMKMVLAARQEAAAKGA